MVIVLENKREGSLVVTMPCTFGLCYKFYQVNVTAFVWKPILTKLKAILDFSMSKSRMLPGSRAHLFPWVNCFTEIPARERLATCGGTVTGRSVSHQQYVNSQAITLAPNFMHGMQILICDFRDWLTRTRALAPGNPCHLEGGHSVHLAKGSTAQ